MSTELLPLDFEALKKGDVIDAVQIDRAYDNGVPFWQKQLRLVGEIEKHRPDLVIRTRKQTIVILSDPEASDCLWERTKKDARSMRRNAKRRGRIDVSALDARQRRVCEHRDIVSGLLAAQAVRGISKAEKDQRILAAGGEVKAPKLPEGE